MHTNTDTIPSYVPNNLPIYLILTLDRLYTVENLRMFFSNYKPMNSLKMHEGSSRAAVDIRLP